MLNADGDNCAAVESAAEMAAVLARASPNKARGSAVAMHERACEAYDEAALEFWCEVLTSLALGGDADVSSFFPPLRSRVRGCRHAHRAGVSLFGRAPFLHPGHTLPSRRAQPGSMLAVGHRRRRREAALTQASTAAR